MILPRQIVPGIVNKPAAVNVRSLGVRTPLCTHQKPAKGILGLFHVLPAALAWLWRLVAPTRSGRNMPVALASFATELHRSRCRFSDQLQFHEILMARELWTITPSWPRALST